MSDNPYIGEVKIDWEKRPKKIRYRAIIISPDNKFVLAQRSDLQNKDNYKWEFPGGKRKKNEKPQNVLMREVKEETGLKIDVKSIEKAHIYNSTDQKRQIITILVHLEELQDIKIPKSEYEEHTKVGWFTKEEALALGNNLREETLEAIIALL